jgi:hypothetical protein
LDFFGTCGAAWVLPGALDLIVPPNGAWQADDASELLGALDLIDAWPACASEPIDA